MEKVSSADGTLIAFDRLGAGAPIIVVGGALCDRAATRPLAEALAAGAQAINYDRRGRGDSGDTAPFAVRQEVADIAALISASGGAAAVYGHSSGAALALHAAAAGLPITALILHEPPYAEVGGGRGTASEAGRAATRQLTEQITAAIAEGRRTEAVELHLAGTGMPPEMIDHMRSAPFWPGMEASAHTLPYDFAALDTAPAELASRVHTPTLVLAGGASPDRMIDVGRQLAAALPRGQHRILPDQEHLVPPEVLCPVLLDFLRPLTHSTTGPG